MLFVNWYHRSSCAFSKWFLLGSSQKLRPSSTWFRIGLSLGLWGIPLWHVALFLDVLTLPLSAFSSLLEDGPGTRQSTSQLSTTYSQTRYKTSLKTSDINEAVWRIFATLGVATIWGFPSPWGYPPQVVGLFHGKSHLEMDDNYRGSPMTSETTFNWDCPLWTVHFGIPPMAMETTIALSSFVRSPRWTAGDFMGDPGWPISS